MTVTRVFADRANRYTPSVVRIIVFSKVTSKMNSLPLWSITELLIPDGMVGIGITLTTDTAGSSTWAAAVFAASKRIKIARNHRIEPPGNCSGALFLEAARYRACAPRTPPQTHRHVNVSGCRT